MIPDRKKVQISLRYFLKNHLVKLTNFSENNRTKHIQAIKIYLKHFTKESLIK